MPKGIYKLDYLPIFYDDVREKINYIRYKLKNPKAAEDLLDALENAILERLPICENFEPFHSQRERKYPYYRIYVKNFIVYYVVINDDKDNKIMEIRRLLYKHQNRDENI